VALRSTIFKAEVQVSDVDRGYYAAHALTIARHPSETDERLMVRLLAFCLHASARLEFGRGISADEEADLWERDDTGAILLWIEVGMPDERALRKACGRSDAVEVLAYGRGVDPWWRGIERDLARLPKLRVRSLAPALTQALAAMAQKSMHIDCTIQDGAVWISGEEERIEIAFTTLLERPSAD